MIRDDQPRTQEQKQGCVCAQCLNLLSPNMQQYCPGTCLSWLSRVGPLSMMRSQNAPALSCLPILPRQWRPARREHALGKGGVAMYTGRAAIEMPLLFPVAGTRAGWRAAGLGVPDEMEPGKGQQKKVYREAQPGYGLQARIVLFVKTVVPVGDRRRWVQKPSHEPLQGQKREGAGGLKVGGWAFVGFLLKPGAWSLQSGLVAVQDPAGRQKATFKNWGSREVRVWHLIGVGGLGGCFSALHTQAGVV